MTGKSPQRSSGSAPRVHQMTIARRLMACFALIILLMLAGNGLLLWQFRQIRLDANRLAGIDQELIAVLRFQASLHTFQDRLNELVQYKDTAWLLSELESLRASLMDDSKRTQAAFNSLPAGVQPDPGVLATFEAIQSSLPTHLDAIQTLAKSGDWTGLSDRLTNEVQPLEFLSSGLVRNVDLEVESQRAQVARNAEVAERRMIAIVLASGLATLLIAAILGWAITRSIIVPLAHLMEGSRALARGEFHHQVSARGRDEIAQLGQVFNDTADRLRSLYETLQSSEDYLEEAQRLTHTGSWVWLVEGREAVHLSSEWYRIYGFDPEKGRPSWEERLQRVLAEDRDRWSGTIERAIRDKSNYDVEFRILLPDGTVKYIHTVGHPVLNAAGELVQFVGSSTDITERKSAEQAVRRSEGYLAEAERLTRSGSWAWNVRTDALFWSREMYRIYEYDAEEVKPTWPTLLARIHPDDRPALERRAQIESTQKERVDSEGDFRILLPDGRIKHLHSIAHPVVDESGEIVEVIGTTMDVTEQREAGAALVAHDELGRSPAPDASLSRRLCPPVGPAEPGFYERQSGSRRNDFRGNENSDGLGIRRRPAGADRRLPFHLDGRSLRDFQNRGNRRRDQRNDRIDV